MDFRYLVLALVISVVAGEDANKNLDSGKLNLNAGAKFFKSSKNEEQSLQNHETAIKQNEKVTHAATKVLDESQDGLLHKTAINNETNNNINASNTLSTSTTTTTATLTINTTTPTTPAAAAASSTTTTSTSTSTTTTTTTTTEATTSTAQPVSEVKSVVSPGTWNVTNGTTFCIVVKMETEFNVTYPGNNGAIYNLTISVPTNASASGSCSNNTMQNISLTWSTGNSFSISFIRNTTTDKFEINLISLTLNTTNFTKIQEGVTNLTYLNKKPDFPAVPVKMSYRCDKQVKQVLVSDKYTANLSLSHTQFEAFMNKTKAVFGDAEDCDRFDTPDIVPIAVGCVLSILVIIVLAAYLIGRRRSQNRGYLSM